MKSLTPSSSLPPREKIVLAYTDETGNTGNHLFDLGQPQFWTGTLVSERDLETEGKTVHAECLRITGLKELHGNELGLGGIEKIASKLRVFFAQENCQFLFTRLDKEHLAGTKFFDSLMDSGINKAVSHVHYSGRYLRLPLAVQFVQLLDTHDRQQYWDAYGRNDPAMFREVLGRVRDRLRAFLAEGIYRERAVQLLDDAITWGMAYPEPLLEGGRSKLDSPNVVAFSLLLAMLHHLHETTGAKVGTFVHDEQNEFAQALRDTYDVLKRLSFDIGILSIMPKVKELPTFGCDLQVRKSRESIGLQLIDVVLWLVKRFVESDGAIKGDCRALSLEVMSRGQISDFTLKAMQSDVIEKLTVMEETPLTPEQISKAREIWQEVEGRRLARMKEPPG